MQYRIYLTYLTFGFFFGALFPLVAIGHVLTEQELSISLNDVIHIHLNTFLLFIIDLAPFVLMSFTFLIAKRECKIIKKSKQLEKELEKRVEAENKIKILSGYLPICSSCKKIRNDEGYWERLEAYIQENSEVLFTHGICPDCLGEYFPGMLEDPIKEN